MKVSSANTETEKLENFDFNKIKQQLVLSALEEAGKEFKIWALRICHFQFEITQP